MTDLLTVHEIHVKAYVVFRCAEMITTPCCYKKADFDFILYIIIRVGIIEHRQGEKGEIKKLQD